MTESRRPAPLRTCYVWQSYRFEAEPDNYAVAMVDGMESFDTYWLRVCGGSMTAFRLAGAMLELALAMKADEDADAEQELWECERAERARLLLEAAEIAKDYAMTAVPLDATHRPANPYEQFITGPTDDGEPF